MFVPLSGNRCCHMYFMVFSWDCREWLYVRVGSDGCDGKEERVSRIYTFGEKAVGFGCEDVGAVLSGVTDWWVGVPLEGCVEVLISVRIEEEI